MNRSNPGRPTISITSPTSVSCGCSMTTKVLVVGADPALAELLEEWLTLESCRAVAERPDVVLVDVPFPRELAVQRLQHIGDEHPGTPVLPMPKPSPGTRSSRCCAARRMRSVQLAPPRGRLGRRLFDRRDPRPRRVRHHRELRSRGARHRPRARGAGAPDRRADRAQLPGRRPGAAQRRATSGRNLRRDERPPAARVPAGAGGRTGADRRAHRVHLGVCRAPPRCVFRCPNRWATFPAFRSSRRCARAIAACTWTTR